MATKVLFIVTQSELGGAQRWVFDTATNLNKDRYEVTVAAGGSGLLFKKLRYLDIRCRDIAYLERKINLFKDLAALVKIYRIIKKEKPDILQLCSTKAGLLGSVAGKLAGVPKIIYRIGGWSFNDPRPAWQNKIFLWLEKLTAPFKDKIVVNSQKGYDEALQYKICSSKKLILIYNGIKNIDVPGIKNVDGGTTVIGAIANNYPTKGLKYLDKAARLVDAKFLVVSGKDNPWQYLAEQGGIDIFVIPSIKEGMPYVLLEAMAAGLPIVATTVGGIPEIIQDKKNGLLVPPKDPKKLAEAIVALSHDRDLRKQLGRQAKEDIKKFSLEKMIKEVETLYQN